MSAQYPLSRDYVMGVLHGYSMCDAHISCAHCPVLELDNNRDGCQHVCVENPLQFAQRVYHVFISQERFKNSVFVKSIASALERVKDD
jgi:hypothetical protein